MTRLAIARLVAAGIDPAPLLDQTGITSAKIDDPDAWLAADGQVMLLNLAADALQDDLLGFHLAQEFDLRQAELLYYVLASSEALGDALTRAERYCSIANESIVLRYISGTMAGIRFNYAGIPRHVDRHQMEFWMTAMVRICRRLTGRDISPIRMSVTHPRCARSTAIEEFVSCSIAFGAGADEVAFARGVAQLRLPNADPYLNKVLVRQCEDALAQHERLEGSFQARVENAIAPLLPHGRARVDDVARALGMSRRTLARRLAEEHLSFTAILERVRLNLAHHYLKDPGLSVSRIAWLLGFQETSAFTNSFRRWTGLTPTQMRTQSNGHMEADPY
ncbi:AraC family transcriptional regulator [Microvirga sp. VF16]|uniref:AraC family transcriptional regulator n=1 Tax=Microvirga sp. VF16 TaxID=2807101 RepID=UPI00193DF882|nr:AraC family transcriptional regulator [Microvirga sp. VF16]QRM28518.1 AraC family transcriptional regulator [Microvirga sp. VF16]